MRKVLISECLCGDRLVRYDGKAMSCVDPILLKWKSEGRLVPVCPEVCGGLPVPRSEAQRVGDKIITKDGADVTAAFGTGAEIALRLADEHDVAFAIMKDGSPSCGPLVIHDGSFSGKKVPGRGLTTERLAAAGYTVFSEIETERAAALLAGLET